MGVPADLLLRDAEALLEERTVAEALRLFDAAEEAGAHPDRCSGGRWMAHTLLGDLDAAWRESDAIRERGAPDPHRMWLGGEIEGRVVMLRCLHGFGDSVQMLRYAPQLAARAAKLIVEVNPHFIELARCFDGVEHVIAWGEQTPVAQPHWDVQIEVNELPYLFRTSASDVPATGRYLRLPRASRAVMQIGAEDKLKVGLVWASGAWNSSRSVPPELLCPLLETPNCEFWNLQGGEALQQATGLCDRPNFHLDPHCPASLLRLAQVISEIDLVITPDTLAAHLAGALDVPAWVMLQRAADWRWMLDREDSPWYPSLRLFRQERAGDWKGVVDTIQQQLAVRAARQQQRQLVR